MARLWSCGFELNSNSVGMEFDVASGGGALSTSTVRSGGYSQRFNGTSALTNYKTLAANTGVIYTRAYVNMAAFPSTGSLQVGLIQLWDSSNRMRTSIFVNSTGIFRNWDDWYGGNGGSFQASLNTWNCLELKLDTTTSPDKITWRVNGVAQGTVDFALGPYNPGIDSNFGSIVWGLSSLGGTAGGSDIYFDDIAVNDGTGSFQNSWPGPGKIIHLRPNAAGDSSSWTASAGSNYTCVDEVTPNDDTDYVLSLTENQEDYYNVDASGLQGTEAVNVVSVSQRGKCLVGTSTLNVGVMKTSGGTKALSGTVNTSTTYKTHSSDANATYPLTTYQDPDGAAWTPVTLDTMQIGLKEIGAATTNRVTAEWALVDYTPSQVVKTQASTFVVIQRIIKTRTSTFKIYGPVSYGALGTVGYTASAGASSITPAYPSGIAAHSGLVLLVGQKPTTANGGGVTTPSGWTLVTSKTASGGYGSTLGVDTGNTNLYAYFKDADGTESGTLTVSLADSDVAWSRMMRCESATGAWTVAGTTGEDTSAGNVSITGNSTLAATTGDLLIGAMCIPTDVTTPAQFSAEAFSATGATFDTAVEIDEPDSSVGNDIGGFIFRQYVTAGPATAAPTMTATAGGTTTNVMGPGVFVLLQGISSTVAKSEADTASAVEASTLATSSSDTGSSTEANSLLITSSDNSSSNETATLGTSSSDTAAGVDTGSVTASLSSSDTSSSVETNSLLILATDTVSSGETESLAITSTEVLAGIESQGLNVTLVDTASFSDVAALSTGLSSSDLLTFVEANSLSTTISSTDVVIGVDAQQTLATVEVPDTSTSVETQSLVVSITNVDSVALTDVQDLSSILVESDDFLATETEILEGGISEYITIDEAYSINALVSDVDVLSSTDVEILDQTVTDGLVIEFEESLTATITSVDELLVTEDSVISLSDTDDFTYLEEQDIAFNNFDDDSFFADEAEEVHELISVSDDDLLSTIEQFTFLDVLSSSSDLSSGLDEEFTSATLVETDEVGQEEDELSAGPTGTELATSQEEAWIDVTLASDDNLSSLDSGLIGQEEIDLGFSIETEAVIVGLFSNDIVSVTDDYLITGVVAVSPDTLNSIDAELTTQADLLDDELIVSVEADLIFDIFADDSLISSEDLVVIDHHQEDQFLNDETLILLEAGSEDTDSLLLIDQADAGSSIGDEGTWDEQSSTWVDNSDGDSLSCLDSGYVDIPVAESISGIESEQLTAFDGDLLITIEAVTIGVYADDPRLFLETELVVSSGLIVDESLVSTDTELLEILADESLTGVEAEIAWDAQVFADDPFLVIDDFTITRVLEHFDDEAITFDESLVSIDLFSSDNGSSVDQLTQLAFSDNDLFFGFDGSWVTQAVSDSLTTVETESVIVNLFSGDSVTGSEGYIETGLVDNELMVGVDSGTLDVHLIEFDDLTYGEDFVAIGLVDDEPILTDEAMVGISVDAVDDEPSLILEDMVSIEADLLIFENYALLDDQSYFLGDSVSDDEATIDAVEAEEVVQVITDDDDLISVNETETKPYVIPQGFSQSELTIMRKLTVFMIKTNPIALALIPEIKTRKDNGSLVYEDGPPRPIQIFRLLPESYQTKPTQIVDGVERVIDYTLLGRWDAEMERGDHWVGVDGKHYKIIELVPYEPYMYEKKGLVEGHG